ncbi:hypothetical protein TNCV_3214451 [Trichonephila clavipes]|nr:hypothetical protein TNCV_3214451 [Trichonephila clavipes]
MKHFLKQRGFFDLPITSNDKVCAQLTFAQTMYVTRSLLTLRPGAVDSILKQMTFLADPSNLLQYRLRCKGHLWTNLLPRAV